MIEQGSSLNNNTQSSIAERVKTWVYQNPEWWVWALASYVWIMMFALAFSPAVNSVHNSSLFFCVPSFESASDAVIGLKSSGILKEPSLTTNIQSSLLNGIIPWVFMLIAMMFPLLKRPIRHVNVSLQRGDSELGVLIFLLGYSFIWTIIGGVYLLIPPIIDSLFESTSSVGIILNGLVFFVAAIAVWLPNRERAISRCDQTKPLHIDGVRFYSSSFQYGVQVGVNCFRMCWAPMLALTLANHSFLLMFAVTAIMLYERYRMKYSSKLSGYAWITVGVILILSNS